MTRRLGRLVLSSAAALAILMAGCARKESPAPAPAPAPAEETIPAPAPPAPEGAVATAEVAGTGITGTVTFRDTGHGIALEARFSGLSAGPHGFHVHEKGDCSGDFSAAGAHFNPGGHAHAGPAAAEAHAGDLGNLMVEADGSAQMAMMSQRLTLDDGPNGIIGKSVILHAQEDDLATQPTGNSGARIACGVIVLQAPAPSGEPAAPAGETAAPSGESGVANH